MARKPRIQFEGAVYHAFNRGVRRDVIFLDDLDRRCFLDTLGEACEKTGWVIHAYVLMPNHYHFLLETPEANLSEGMQWLQGTYATRFRLRHGLVGHVFENRFKSPLIEPDSAYYFQAVAGYIHLNPVRARGLLEGEKPLEAYRWSSYPEYLSTRARRPPFLVVDRVLGNLGLADDRSGRRAYYQHMRERTAQLRTDEGRKALEGEWKDLREGWCLGSDPFRERMLDELEAMLQQTGGKSYQGEAKRSHDEREAARLMNWGLSIVGLDPHEIGRTRKTDPRKQVLAWLIRSRTTVSNRWLSDQLHMGHPVNVSQSLGRVRAGRSAPLRELVSRLREALKSNP